MSSKSDKPKSSKRDDKSKEERKRAKKIAAGRDLIGVSIGVCVSVTVFGAIVLGLSIWLIIAAATQTSVFAPSQSTALRRNSFANFVAKSNRSAAAKFSRVQIKSMTRETIAQSSGNTFEIPKTAVRVSTDVYYLGEFVHKTKGRVKGFVNIYRKQVNSTEADLDQMTGDAGVGCATFLATGTRWKGNAEPFSLGYFNSFGISPEEMEAAVEGAMCTWQSELNYQVFGSNNPSVLADGPDGSFPDGKNEIQFGSISDSGILAATTIWGQFDGPVEERYIAETDILFNENQKFTLDGTADSYSFKNILTHELGHWTGLGDIYDETCKEATMYGYASKGETKKVSLLKIDSDAIRELYGETSDPYPTNTKCSSPFTDSAPKTSDAVSINVFKTLMLFVILFLSQ